MHPAFIEEFRSVDAVIESNVRTAGVDAFALSLLKVERQARRLVTHLVYQYPCFDEPDVSKLRAALAGNRGVYFRGFLRGFDALYPTDLEHLVGAEFQHLKARLDVAQGYRNKLFHGQLTDDSLSRPDLFSLVADMRRWSELVSDAGHREFGYTGFGGSSFAKSQDQALSGRLRLNVQSVNDYKAFIKGVLQG